MTKRENGAFMMGKHYCSWSDRGTFFSLHILLYSNSFDSLDEPCFDERFTGKTIKEAAQRFRDWLAVPENLKPYQDEREAIAL